MTKLPALPRWLMPAAFLVSAGVVVCVARPADQPRPFGPDMGFVGPLAERMGLPGPLYPRLDEEGPVVLIEGAAAAAPSPSKGVDDPIPQSEP